MSLDDFNSDKNDLESSLLQQFSCMSTNNKEDLIREFQRLLAPNELNHEGCTFFLDMANWNLQNAICSYFDYDAHKLLQQPLPKVQVIGDATIGEGEEIPPYTGFTKTWKIANSGSTQWPSGCFFTFLGGDRMGPIDRVLIDSLQPGQMTEVSVSMVSPSEPGTYQGQWRMCCPTGQYFGDVIWCIISVAEGGLLGLTQQMSSFNVLDASAANQIDNPFDDQASNHHRMANNNETSMNNQVAIPSSNPFEQSMRNLQVQRIKDSEMQIDEDNKN